MSTIHSSVVYTDPASRRGLIRATLSDIHQRLNGFGVFNGWNDDLWDKSNPALRWIRPSMERDRAEGGRGPGGSFKHQIGGCVQSTPANVYFMKEGTDPTLIETMQRWGYLHEYELVKDSDALLAAVKRRGIRLLGTDAYSPMFDGVAINSRAAFIETGDKAQLHRWVAEHYMPHQEVIDLEDGGLEEVLAGVSDGGKYDVYLKSVDGQHGGTGVYPIHQSHGLDEMMHELELLLADRRLEVREANRLAAEAIRSAGEGLGITQLSTKFVLQRGLKGLGTNKSFQIFLDPRERDLIPVLAVSDQLTSDGGKNLGNFNVPVDEDSVRPIGAAICSLAERVWSAFPDAFGTFMADFFHLDDGRVILYDLGLRPSANTPAAYVRMRAEQFGYTPFLQSDWKFETGKPGTTFAEIVDCLGELLEPDSVFGCGRGLYPLGWNPIQGDGRFVVMVRVADEENFSDTGKRLYRTLVGEVIDRLQRRFPEAVQVS